MTVGVLGWAVAAGGNSGLLLTVALGRIGGIQEADIDRVISLRTRPVSLEDAKFAGDYFCRERGTSCNTHPSGFDEKIGSIRVQCKSNVTIYNQANFRSYSATTRKSVSDLQTAQLHG
jgi:hypothetical protein